MNDKELRAVAEFAGIPLGEIVCVEGSPELGSYWAPVPYDIIHDTATWEEGLEEELLSDSGMAAILKALIRAGWKWAEFDTTPSYVRFENAHEDYIEAHLEEGEPDLNHAVLSAAIAYVRSINEKT